MSAKTQLSLGYGLGSMVRVGENLFGFYLIFFLTTVGGVNPALAGVIGGVGLLIGAIGSPIVGFLSDRSRSRFGKRRPIMLATIVPSMVLLTLLFTRVDFGSATGIYYLVVAVGFAITYYGFLVPYDAIGATLTTDYDERTAIRSVCTAVLYITVLIGGTLVLQVQGVLAGALGDTASWTVAVLLCCSIPGIIFGLLAWRITRGREPIGVVDAAETASAPESGSSLRVFTLRPVVSILLWGVIYFFANGIIAGTMIYLGVYVIGLPESAASTYFTISTITTLVAIIPGNYLAKRVGKRNAIFVAIAIFVIAAVTMGTIGFDSYLSGAIVVGAFGVCNSIVLSCSYAMIYDLRELTQYALGSDKTAVILGWFTLVIGGSGALSAITVGAVLGAVGFDPAAPSAAVVTAISALQTWVPAALMLVSAAVLAFWNFNATAHASVTERIQQIAGDLTDEAAAPELQRELR